MAAGKGKAEVATVLLQAGADKDAQAKVRPLPPLPLTPRASRLPAADLFSRSLTPRDLTGLEVVVEAGFESLDKFVVDFVVLSLAEPLFFIIFFTFLASSSSAAAAALLVSIHLLFICERTATAVLVGLSMYVRKE